MPQSCGPACPFLETLDETQRTTCEIWTRVMGYHRPVSQFNDGKQAEHRERRYFRQPAAETLSD